MPNNRTILIATIIATFTLANPALAYVGPGAGLSAIGSILAFLGVIVLMILGFIWYPVKRMIASMRKKSEAPEANETPDQDTL